MRPVELSTKDRRLLAQIQGDLPLCTSPFAAIARKTGWEEEELLRRVRFFIRRGMIRRFGAILRHQKAGYRGNAMAVWKVPEDQVVKVSRAMVACRSVSHCYLRPPHPRWPFNVYTMLHGESEKECRHIARQISRKTGVKNFRLLFSRREHKKSSMDYF
jgi:siroheme decarboxylase